MKKLNKHYLVKREMRLKKGGYFIVSLSLTKKEP